MSDLGKLLKSEREKKSISLQEVGLSLKISPRIIQSLEDGKKDGLPARTFLRGFVKSYAQYLKIDHIEALRIFELEFADFKPPKPILSTEIPSENASSAKINPQPEPNSPKSVPSSLAGFSIWKTVLGVVLFVCIVIVAKLIEKYQNEKELPEHPLVVVSIEKTESSPAPEDLKTNNGTVGNSTVPETNNKIEVASPIPSPSPTTAPISTPVNRQSPVSTPSPLPSQTPTPNPSPILTPTPSPSPSPIVTPTPAEKTAPRFEVLIEASEPGSFSYKSGDKEVEVSLASGEIHVIRASSPVEISTATGSAFSYYFNGKLKTGTSKNPGPLKLRFPE